MSVIAGIDYSMTSPSICVHIGTEWSFNNCKFFYMMKKDKHIVITEQLKGTLYPEWSCDPERYDNLSQWSIGILKEYSVEKAYIESYSFGSVGRVFQIAENTGALKYQLWKKDIPYDVYPPTMIKKFGTGKGNANKEKMWESFKEETGYNIFNIIAIEEGKNWNPVSDIVDAYYIAKLGFHNQQTVDI
jgi:Holliday junction resolvasome RuvABC endonuclease subunit